MSEKDTRKQKIWNFKVDLNIHNARQWTKCFNKKSVKLGKQYCVQKKLKPTDAIYLKSDSQNNFKE